jgi:hypothetical protein
MSDKKIIVIAAPVAAQVTEIVLASEQQLVLKSSNRPAKRDRSET